MQFQSEQLMYHQHIWKPVKRRTQTGSATVVSSSLPLFTCDVQILHLGSWGLPRGGEGEGVCSDGAVSSGQAHHSLPGAWNQQRPPVQEGNCLLHRHRAGSNRWADGERPPPLRMIIIQKVLQGWSVLRLQLDRTRLTNLQKDPRRWPTHITLVAESSSFTQREKIRVLVSRHRGSIFIQTDQPIYNPDQKGYSEKCWIKKKCKWIHVKSQLLCSPLVVNYRIFTLDHTFRPLQEVFHISVFVSRSPLTLTCGN